MIYREIKKRLPMIIVLSIIAIIGSIKSFTILGGDQSLFTVIAQMFDAGKILYQDLFDYKQPGIFMFYYLAGKTLGWNDIGIHYFELGYWLVFSLILYFSIKQYDLFYKSELTSSLFPLFAIGAYYCNASAFHLTQLEALINVPLYLIAWLLDRAYKNENNLWITYLVIGLLMGVVVLCKLIFAPIILSFLLIHFFFCFRSKGLMHILRKQLLPMIIGGFIPIAIFLNYIFSHHIENLVTDIFFKIPTQVIGLGDQVHPERLWESIKWLGKKMILFLILAGLGTFLISKKESHFFSMIIAWLIIGFVVVVMQKTSWWSYHFQLFYVPIALLSVLGLDYIFRHLLNYLQINNSWKRIPILLIILGLITHNQLQLLQESMNSESYAKLMRFDYAKNHVLSVLKVLKEEDTIFVCGNPRKYLMTSRLPELSTNGWILEYYLDYQWQNFYEEFQNKPPTYLFVSNEYETLIPKKNPKLWDLITAKYLKFSSEENGIWYKIL
ncbi:MAG: hypothetical protein LM517_10840 [Nitrosomonas sp.]|nr:hypothetical protein [Nitrosomonas sp.]